MRTLPPVHSPVGLGDLLASAVAAIGGSNTPSISEELESRFAGERVVLASSGTQALQHTLELLASTVGEDVVVALPGYSCYDLVTAATGARVKAHFYDIDPETLAPRFEDLQRVLEAGVHAVVAGNLHAFPLDWASLHEACDGHEALLIEDAAQGIGAQRPEAPYLPAATILSFGRGKGWTGGGGGAAILRAPLAGTHATVSPGGRGVGTFGKATLAWLLGRPSLFAIPSAIPWLGVGETHYKAPTPVTGANAFATHLVARSDRAAWAAPARRREVAARWSAKFEVEGSNEAVSACVPLEDFECGYLRYPVVAPSQALADEWVRTGHRYGFARGYPIALPRLRESSPLLAAPEVELPGSSTLASRLVTLPTHGWVRESDHDAVARLLKGS